MRIYHHGPNRTRIYFDCPKKPGKECGVLLKPWPIKDGKTWDWNGNVEKPTLSPSISCVGCGWHGFIVNGELTNVGTGLFRPLVA